MLRAFQLKESASFPANGNAELLREGEADPLQAAVMGSSAPTQDIWQPRTCSEYVAAMNDVRARCEDEGMVPMYHYTDPKFAKSILLGGLRMSTQGQVSIDTQVHSGKKDADF